MKGKLDDIDWALIEVMSEEEPPRMEGWLVPELAQVPGLKKFNRSHDTYRNHLRHLRDHPVLRLVESKRVVGLSGSPLAFCLTLKGWRKAALGPPKPLRTRTVSEITKAEREARDADR